MKKITFPKGTMIRTAFIACTIFLSSCDFSQKPKDSKLIAEEKNELRFEIKREENDAQFLVNAAEINLEEIQLAQLAQKKWKCSTCKGARAKD